MGQKIGCINGMTAYYRGRLKFHDLRAVMTKYMVNRFRISWTTVLIKINNEDTAYRVIETLKKNIENSATEFQQVHL